MVPESLLWFLQEQAAAGTPMELRVDRTSVVDAPAFLLALDAFTKSGGLKAGPMPSTYLLGPATLRLRGAAFQLDPKELGTSNAAALMQFMAALGDALKKPVVLAAPGAEEEALRYNPLLRGFRSPPKKT